MNRCGRSWGCGWREVFCLRIIGTVIVGLFLISTGMAQQGTTVRVSVSSSGAQASPGIADDFTPSISADGRYVVFTNVADNLAPGDANGKTDVFVRDRMLGTTELVSVSSTGEIGNSWSGGSSISSDGRYVAFNSSSDNLVIGDTNGAVDVFVRDRLLGTTELVSVSSTGEQADADSSLGGLTISADGRYVVFDSRATNLVAGDTNGHNDVFVRDRQSGTTERISVSSTGDPGNFNTVGGVSISADGRYVAFASASTNLVESDTNGAIDVFVRDRKLGTTELVSVSSTGAQGHGLSFPPVISADGRFVAFRSSASNLVDGDTNNGTDIFIRDRQLGTTELVSASSSGQIGNGQSQDFSMSPDGRFVAFSSSASNLVPGDTNGR